MGNCWKLEDVLLPKKAPNEVGNGIQRSRKLKRRFQALIHLQHEGGRHFSNHSRNQNFVETNQMLAFDDRGMQ